MLKLCTLFVTSFFSRFGDRQGVRVHIPEQNYAVPFDRAVNWCKTPALARALNFTTVSPPLHFIPNRPRTRFMHQAPAHMELRRGTCDLLLDSGCDRIESGARDSPDAFLLDVMEAILSDCNHSAVTCNTIDIGSNLGLISLRILQSGALLTAVEPQTDLCCASRASAQQNNFGQRSRFLCAGVGVSGSVSEGDVLSVSPKNYRYGLHAHSKGKISQMYTRLSLPRSVPLLKLSSIVGPRGTHYRFIKIDTDSVDCDLLRELLDRQRKGLLSFETVSLEVWTSAHCKGAKFARLLSDLQQDGYDLYRTPASTDNAPMTNTYEFQATRDNFPELTQNDVRLQTTSLLRFKKFTAAQWLAVPAAWTGQYQLLVSKAANLQRYSKNQGFKVSLRSDDVKQAAAAWKPLPGRLLQRGEQITTATFPLNPRAQVAHVHRCAAVRFSMFVHDPAHCRFLSRDLLAGGWECPIIEQIVAAMSRAGRDEYFMDIGSNIGAFSLTLAHSGARVLAFDAMAYNTELQVASAGTFLPPEYLKQRRWRLFHAAVAPRTGGVLCVHPTQADNAGNGKVYDGPCKKGDEATPRFAIDDLMAAQPDLADACVYVVKADVEGFEGPAFRGASAMFSGRCPPCLVFMENFPKFSLEATGDARDAFHVLSGHGYACEPLGNYNYRCANTLPEHATRCATTVVDMGATTTSGTMPSHVVFSTFTRVGKRAMIEKNTRRCWDALSPRVHTVWFHDELDTNAQGTPILSAMYQEAMRRYTGADTYTYVNGDLLVDDGFVATADAVVVAVRQRKIKSRFLVVGQRTNVNWKDRGDFKPELFDEYFRAGALFETNAEDYFMVSETSFDWDKIPPFVIGRPGYDNWLVDQAFHAPDMVLIDATRTIRAVHQTGFDGNSAGHKERPDKHYNHELARARGTGQNPFDHGRTTHANWVTLKNNHKVVLACRSRN